MLVDFASVSSSSAYHMMIQTIIPRPIAWVLTTNQTSTEPSSAGSFNLAPFSYFTPVSSSPPVVLFSVGQKPDGSPKDTLANIEAGSEFVVHIASTDLASQVNTSSAGLAYGHSELDELDLELVDVAGWDTPRIDAAKIAFNCRRFDVSPLANSVQTLVMGQIAAAFIDDELITDDTKHLEIDASKIDPLARLGGANYAPIGPVFTIPRPV